jgi:hypothetical protein
MEVKVTLKPGQNGTKHLVEHYGDQLICVRYRYDKVKRKRYKTVELIIDEQAWIEGYQMSPHVVPRREPIGPVLVKTDYHEVKLRNAAKEAGGQWYPKEKAWKLPYDTAIALGLDQRILRFLKDGEQ